MNKVNGLTKRTRVRRNESLIVALQFSTRSRFVYLACPAANEERPSAPYDLTSSCYEQALASKEMASSSDECALYSQEEGSSSYEMASSAHE
jgi:hypothetical protein